jgi:ABC-type polysaccharide/polyol phosphate transport system ATPase subunit
MSADTSAPAVVVDDVSKAFVLPHERVHTLKERALHPLRRSSADRLQALRNVSFEVAQGEFFGIVGRNGSGKSTLLKCLAGIYRVDSGQIFVNGRMATFIELGVGFNPDLAARDNVMINAVMLGVPVKEARQRFDEVIAFAELEEFVDLKLKNYSSGMLVRLAFAAAIQAETDILLIDEVLAVGDASFQQKCFDVFNRLKAEGRTILFVTHDMASVKRFCDRALLLERGEVVTIDAPDAAAELYLEHNFGHAAEDRREGLRWSEGLTEILDTWMEKPDGTRSTTFMATSQCVFRARVKFLAPMIDPNFNVVWVNEQGDSIFAVSTAASEGTGEFAAGETVTLSISFMPSLAPGRYGLTMNLSRRGSGQQVVEHWHDMFTILIGSATAGGGLVDLPHELTIEREPQASMQPGPTR